MCDHRGRDQEPGRRVSGYYDAFEAARLVGTNPSTIRSWVKRGTLPAGRFLGGRLQWTKRQLVTARDQVRGDAITPAPSQTSVVEARCGCGMVANAVPGLDGYIMVTCHGCSTTMAIQTATQFIYRSEVEPLEMSIAPSGDAQAILGSRAAMIEVDKHKGRPFVYFIRLGPYVKIGTSSDVRGRIGALSLAPGNLLAVIPGTYDVEKATHRRFANLRAFREWFYLQDALLAYVSDLQRSLIQTLIDASEGGA